MTLRDSALAIFVVIIWGVNFTIVKFGLEELPPILFSALRFAIVAIPAVFFIPFPKTSIWNVIGVGVFLGILKYSFLFYAMVSDASAGLSSLILQVQVFFTIGLSIFFFKETVTKPQLLGIIVAILGFSLFFFTTSTNITTLGLSLILLAGFSWAISNLIMKRIKGVNLLHFIIWVCLIPPLPLFLLSYLLESQEPLSLVLSTTINSWGSLAFSSYISMLVAFAIWGWLLKTYSSATVTPYALLVPVVGILTSSLVLSERMNNIEITGTVLIMLGLLFSALGGRYFKKI